jgi:hypothetical protein
MLQTQAAAAAAFTQSTEPPSIMALDLLISQPWSVMKTYVERGCKDPAEPASSSGSAIRILVSAGGKSVLPYDFQVLARRKAQGVWMKSNGLICYILMI